MNGFLALDLASRWQIRRDIDLPARVYRAMQRHRNVDGLQDLVCGEYETPAKRNRAEATESRGTFLPTATNGRRRARGWYKA
jgi:hypothetical protein